PVVGQGQGQGCVTRGTGPSLRRAARRAGSSDPAVVDHRSLTVAGRCQMKKTIMWAVLLVCTALISGASAQSTDEAARRLSGMWRLVANPSRLADGTTREGTNIGYAFFDASGHHMCFLSMAPNRPVWKSGS